MGPPLNPDRLFFARGSMKTTFENLLKSMQELRDLGGVIGLCTWDQETFLPEAAQNARADQLATLQAVYHRKLTDERLGEALEEAASNPSLSADALAMVRVLRHERHRAVKVSERWVRELATAQSEGLSAWREARKQRRFAGFAPALGRLLALRQEQAFALGYEAHPYDALLDHYEPGMTVSVLSPVLEGLKKKLVPMVGQLSEASLRVPDLLGGKTFHAAGQWQLCQRLLQDMGFDFRSGRLDKSIHPFTGGTHPHDVRLTTRIDEKNPLPALFGAIHEGGHGLYEQGFLPAHHRTPLAQAPSMGLHESQSRLWENLVGRSRGFWAHYLPFLKETFPDAFQGVSLDDFYAFVNRVRRTCIRVEADEVTYNLHIILRYELERALVSNDLPLSDLPQAWNQKMTEMLGITPPDDLQGVLQDIHWAWGEFGYFPTYALGNLYSATLFQTASRNLPNLPLLLSQGQLLPLRRWLLQNIHQEGFRFLAQDLVKKVCGKGLNDEDFVSYLHEKYGVLFG